MLTASKTALITGACGGIGLALVQAFHDAGYHVIATDIAENPVGLPSCTQYVAADLGRFATDESFASKVLVNVDAALGAAPLNVLINNAAVQILGGVDNLSRADWQTTLNVNLLAPFLLSQALLPKLEAAKGCIINIGSIHARLTKKNFVAYATSKAALAGMTRAMAVDLGPRVRVNTIEPAAIETEMLKAGFADNPDGYRALADYHPQRRIGQVDEVARLALWMVQGNVPFVHGSCVALDGGISGRLFDPE